ncbi:MAG: EAL domain-containing protein [Pseudohongiella sp.]|nr:EAL domain-containing protein [Pseudohongiella sp.]
MTVATMLIGGLAIITAALLVVLEFGRRGWTLSSPEDRHLNAHLNAQSRRILSSAVEQSHSGVVIADCTGVIEYVNPRYSQITGYSSSEAVGRLAELMNNDELTDANNLTLQEAMQLGAGWETFMVSIRKNGDRFWQQVTASPIHDDLGSLSHIVLNIDDISERVETQAQMEKLAFYDPLTGLENRRLFRDRLDQGLKRVRRSKKGMALLFLDLDQFKRINDTLGHDAGDELLCVVAQRLRSCVREEDIVSRLGGDEFTILLADIAHADDASLVARKILKALQDPIPLGEQEVIVSCSIGITIAPEDSMNASVLMRNADLAMYRAKDQGRNNFQYFTDDMNIESQARMSLENELRLAVNNEDFVVFFQPQVNLNERRICGFEALVRWRHEQVDLISPDRFIPVAEETGLIIKVGEIVLRQACRQMSEMQARGLTGLTVAVNLSARQFRDRNLVSMIRKTLQETGLEPQWLELEITESMLMDNIEQAIDILTELKAIGVTIAIDDFGTGYSSLSYLTRLPVDKLKVDRSFVSNLPESPRHTAIATAIIAMAQRLRLQVVAEGVETQPQADFLHGHQCSILQGYLFGRPVDASELPAQMLDLEKRISLENLLLPVPALAH